MVKEATIPVNKATPQRRGIRKQNVTQLLIGLAIIFLLNVISAYVFTRVDLTAEKRYSLSPATKKLLKGLDDVVYFKIYLDGDFPAGFKRLRNATKEMLDEFRAYTDNIQYQFINPSAQKDKKDRNELYRQLVEKGLQPTDLQVKKDDGTSRTIIFPGALVTLKNEELPIQLLINQINIPPEEVLNHSVQGLEYSIANTIRKLSILIKPKIAIIEGQGELGKYEMADITQGLSENYDVERIKIDGKLNSLEIRDAKDSNNVRINNKYQAIIIAKPDSAFAEKDKFLIDQYIMRGGKVVWLIDPVFTSLDSLNKYNETMGIANKLNLDDQLFHYGVRLNTNLIMDLNALPIPLKTGQQGNQPQFDFFPWYFFPLIAPNLNHPITNNLNSIKTEFISSLDTIETVNVKKTILLKSSTYSRKVNVPVLVSWDILRTKPDERLYQGPPQPVAVLLEGSFKSLYNNRIPPAISENKQIGFLNQSKPTKMIVFSDGDIIKNYYDYRKGTVYPCGYDRYTRQQFGNRDLILNAVDYLLDDSGLISIRTREVKLRLLDMNRVNKARLGIQLANTLFPVLLVLLFGIIQAWLRKRKYTN